MGGVADVEDNDVGRIFEDKRQLVLIDAIQEHLEHWTGLLIDDGRGLQVAEIEKPGLSILAASDELVVFVGEGDGVDLGLVGDQLLTLHRVQVPDAADAV